MNTEADHAPWFPDASVAVKDANGRDLGYAGPDGKTLYYRGFPVGSASEWLRIQALTPPK